MKYFKFNSKESAEAFWAQYDSCFTTEVPEILKVRTSDADTLYNAYLQAIEVDPV